MLFVLTIDTETRVQYNAIIALLESRSMIYSFDGTSITVAFETSGELAQFSADLSTIFAGM